MSIVEKMARAYVEYNRKLHEEAARVEDYENYEWAELGALMAAALTATGLTEAQLEGLANGTMVCVPVEPTSAMIRDGVSYRLSTKIGSENRWPEDTAALYRAMLAAKEG